MVKAYAVIGANYGDEGKGLVTNYLCHTAFSKNQKVVNILTNGGCQRGHTAYDKNGKRHVYSHFGSGYSYADIYFSKFYMVNPMIFITEYVELTEFNNIANDNNSNIYIDKDCTLTTPYDMLINRAKENRRTKKHGSCGYGIWETVLRNDICPLYWKDFLGKSKKEIEIIIKDIRDNYFQTVLDEYNIQLTQIEQEIFYSDNTLLNYVSDILAMQSIVKIKTLQSVIEDYDILVFENAQGLLLDKDYDKWGTPTKTGLSYVIALLGNKPVTPFYVTRSYLTKHGNGDFPGECNKEDINKDMFDQTNQPNKYQGSLRYGKFDKQLAKDLLNRIKQDATGYDFKIVVTHINEFISPYLKFADYVSYNETEILANLDIVVNSQNPLII